MDITTFRQLKESRYHNPVITEVMFDYDMMLEMVFHSMTIIEKGYDTVWDANVFNFITNYFQEGMEYVEGLITQNKINIRLIVEATLENIDSIETLKQYEIKCLDDIKGNFGIFDNRAYMVCIFHTGNDKPDQTLWSNSKELVDKQQLLFDKMWNMAIPLSIRKKELEYEKRKGHKKKIKDLEVLQNEIDSLMVTCKKEMMIFASTNTLLNILSITDFINYFPSLLRNGIRIKILLDDEDIDLSKRINEINNFCHHNKILLSFTKRINEFSELVIIRDDKYMLQIKLDSRNELDVSFSSEGYNIILQKILFEKHWNDIESLFCSKLIK